MLRSRLRGLRVVEPADTRCELEVGFKALKSEAGS